MTTASIVFTVTYRPYKKEVLAKVNYYAETVQEAIKQFRADYPLADLIKVSRQYI